MQLSPLIHRLGISLFLLTFATLTFAQQRGQIKGRVITSDNKPAAFITVVLKGTTIGTHTDVDGSYQLTGIKSGNYTLIISAVGSADQQKDVAVESGKTLIIDLIITENAAKLSEVIVTGNKTNKFSRRQTDNVARMPLENLENSQVYNVVTKELAQEQVAIDLKDYLKNAPGVAGVTSINPLLGRVQLQIRGFSQIFTVKNGMQVNSNYSPDPISFEKIDILKGPSATLFGGAGFGMSYGGFVNQETKKPYDTKGGEVSYSYGGYGLNRLTADVNTPLNEDKTALFRINAAAQTQGSFQDYGYYRTYTVNPSFLYKVTDKFTVRAEFDLQQNTSAGATNINPYGSGVTARNWKDVGLNYTSSYGSDDLPNKVTYTDAFLQAEYKISPNWKSQTNFMFNYFTTDLRIFGATLLNDTQLQRSGQGRYDISNYGTNIQQNFIGDFKVGSFRNRVLIGADYLKNTDGKQNFYHNDFDVDVINYRTQSAKTITMQDFDTKAIAAGITDYGGIFTAENYGAYVSDVFNISDNLLAMAGVRYNAYKDHTGVGLNGEAPTGENQNNFSPKFGLVWQPIKDRISLFANYQNSFTNQFGTDAKGNHFKPEHANQLEGGIKADLFKGFSGSISFYDIKVTDVLRTDDANPNFSIQDGDQRNRGVEADIIYNPFAGMNIIAGYGYIDAKYTRSDAGIQGKTPTNVPKSVANFWISYRVPYGQAKGLGAGIGGNYSGNSYANSINDFTIPSYTLLDGTVFYDQPKFRIGLKANNLANIKTWNQFGPQPLRQVIANLTVKF